MKLRQKETATTLLRARAAPGTIPRSVGPGEHDMVVRPCPLGLPSCPHPLVGHTSHPMNRTQGFGFCLIFIADSVVV